MQRVIKISLSLFALSTLSYRYCYHFEGIIGDLPKSYLRCIEKPIPLIVLFSCFNFYHFNKSFLTNQKFWAIQKTRMICQLTHSTTLISLLQYEIRITAHYWNIPHDDVIWFIHIAYTTFISKLTHLLKQLKLYFRDIRLPIFSCLLSK